MNNIKPQAKKYDKLYKMLTTSALSVALISWYTTANGLNKYVFTHLWQAYVISAAFQGALFSLSIMGIELLSLFKNIWKKGIFIIAWICLLCTSSIFSYIYISSDVYTDQLLREDAQRILNIYCLEENYNLLAASNELMNGSDNDIGIEDAMMEYVNVLSVTENGIEFSDDNEKQLSDVREVLSKYHVEEAGASVYIDTIYLVNYINTILSGKYTENDVQTIEKEVENITDSINQQLDQYNSEIKRRKKTASDYQKRLDGFTETTSDAYHNLSDLLKEELSKIDKSDSLIAELNQEKKDIERVNTVIQSINGSMESILYDKVLEIRTEMNSEKINTENVQIVAEEIYKTLLENGITADDQRLNEYAHFKDNLKKYANVVKAQEKLEREITALYNISSSENSNNEIVIEDWNSNWQNHFNELKQNVQTLQMGGLDPSKVNNLIKSIGERERLYLSDLNDFERAIALLFGKNPEHPYRNLLLFSFCFSFGIDLFSVLMSCLLYLIKRVVNQ